jgi:hypothetical protein
VLVGDVDHLVVGAFAHGFAFRQWLTPQALHVTGGGEGSSEPHEEQKRTGAMVAR